MGSFFEASLFGAAFSMLDEIHGQTVSYTAAGSGAVDATGICTPERLGVDPVVDGRQIARRTIALLPTVATVPSSADRFSIGGVAYSVEGIELAAGRVVFSVYRYEQRTSGGDASAIRA